MLPHLPDATFKLASATAKVHRPDLTKNGYYLATCMPHHQYLVDKVTTFVII